MALGKGIPVINGFDLNSKLPLDSRAVADTMEDMNALVTNGSVGDGQLCYCKADKKLYVLKDNVWSEVGGGGGESVPPTLNLLDMETGQSRTSITEEEKTNLENGLYNNVIFPGLIPYEFQLFMPSKLIGDKSFDVRTFVQFNYVISDYTVAINALSFYKYSLGEKDTSGNYPITIEKQVDIPIGSSGGGGGSGEGITPKPITSTDDYASLTDTDYFISVNITGNSNVKDGTYILSGNKANGYSYWYPEDKSEGLNMQTYWHYIHYDSTGLTAIIFNSFLNLTDNNKVGFGFNSDFPDNHIFGGFAVRQVPLFSKYTLVTNTTDEITPILPCTASDNGKVLSVVNGEAQWASVGGQKVYTCAITDLLSISDIQNLIGVITSSQSSTAKRYNLLKSIDDIINEYDYIYVDTSALQMPGGLTFRKQINAGTNKNFSLCYGYFNFDSSSNKMGSFANIVISLSDAWYVETISSLTLLPNVDGTSTNNGKVLTFDTNSLSTNGVPYKWASVGGSGSIPALPSDASTSTYVLKTVNGTIKWVKES